MSLSIRKISLIAHTHFDAGYTDLPETVVAQQVRHLQTALNLAQKDPDFRWTIESAALAENFLRSSSADQRSSLFRCLRSGQMELGGLYMQYLTETADSRTLRDCCRYATALGQKEHFPVQTVLMDDIAGYVSGFWQHLSAAGIRYFIAGAGSFQEYLPWAQLPHCFRMKFGGEQSILFWNLGIDREENPAELTSLNAVYGMGATYIISPALQELYGQNDRGVELETATAASPALQTRFRQLLNRLERENYPYEELLLQCGGDNRGPLAELPEIVREINRRGLLTVPLELTTPSDFFTAFEKKYGESIPEIRGVITDPWCIRTNPAPSALRQFRRAQRNMRKYRIRSLNQNISEDERDVQNADENIRLYTEHTCGLANWFFRSRMEDAGIRSRVLDLPRQSYKIKALYAEYAELSSERLLRRSRQRAAAGSSEEDSILIFNDSPDYLSGIACFSLEAHRPLQKILTADGIALPFQQLFEEQILLSCGHRLAPGEILQLKPVFQKDYYHDYPKKQPMPASFTNFWFTASFNEMGDLVSLKRNCSRTELLEAPLGSLIYEELENLGFQKGGGMIPPQKTRHFVSPRKAALLSDGPIALEVRQYGDLKTPSGGIIRYERDLLLYHDFPRIDLTLRLDKPEELNKESVLLRFPFRGKHPQFRIGQGELIINPAKDLLPGSMTDSFYVNDFLAVDFPETGTIIIQPTDAPVFELGNDSTAAWNRSEKFIPESAECLAQIYHNYLNTDCPVIGNVLDSFRFRILLADQRLNNGQAAAAAAALTPADAMITGTLRNVSPLPPLQYAPEKIRICSLERITPDTIACTIANPAPETVTTSIFWNKQEIRIELPEKTISNYFFSSSQKENAK